MNQWHPSQSAKRVKHQY